MLLLLLPLLLLLEDDDNLWSLRGWVVGVIVLVWDEEED